MNGNTDRKASELQRQAPATQLKEELEEDVAEVLESEKMLADVSIAGGQYT